MGQIGIKINTKNLEREIVELKKAVKEKPEHGIEVKKLAYDILSVVETTKKGNITQKSTFNRKFRGNR